MRVWSARGGAVSMTLSVAIALAASRNARAEEVPEGEDPARWLKELDLEAGSAEADLRLRELDLRDGVRVRLPPYYLRADRIHLSLGQWGVRVKGTGLLTFCPCDAPPVAVGFSGGWAGPPDELIVENPTLRVLGVPIFWLPYLWLRSPRKIGLTTPDVSVRGPDGLFLGQGLHVPIGRGLELGAGIYTRGGVAMTADLATDRTSTLVRFDFRRRSDVGGDVPSGAGLAVDARGNIGNRTTLTWDVDAIRGARGVRTTLDLEPLARPYDHADALARLGPVAMGVTAIDTRGAPIDSAAFARPWVGLLGAVPLGALGGSNGSILFGPRWVRGRSADTIGDASFAASIAGPVGISILSLAARADGRVARAGDAELPGDRASAIVSELRGEASLPLARPIALDRAAGGPPVLHVIEPLVRATAIGARASGDRNALAGFVAAPAFADGTTARLAFLTSVGARTSLGTLSSGIAPGRDPWIGKLSAEFAVGALQIDRTREATLAGDLRWNARRADGGSTLIALQGATARGLDDRRGVGWIVAGRTRWEYSREGFGAELRGAARDQLSVLAGWALLGAELAPRLTTATGLSAPGTTVGVGTAFPLGFGVRLGGDVDVYGATARALFERGGARLLDVRGTFRYRHPCGCFRLAIRGGRVIGREGIDVFASFELAKTDPNDPRDF
jgi:hypothetical protein